MPTDEWSIGFYGTIVTAGLITTDLLQAAARAGCAGWLKYFPLLSPPKLPRRRGSCVVAWHCYSDISHAFSCRWQQQLAAGRWGRRRFSFCCLALASLPRLLRCHTGGRRGGLQARHAREFWLAWPLIAPRRCSRRLPARVLAVLPVPLHLGERSLQRLLVVLIVPAEPAAIHRRHEDLPVWSGCSCVEHILVQQEGSAAGFSAE